jgi:heat shock protein HslJ
VAGYDGRTWRLTRGVAIDPAAPITARFVDGTLSGTIGSAHYRASYDADGDALRIGPLSHSVSGEDRGYGTLLGTVASARVDGAGLELRDGSGAAVLTFEAAPDVDAALVGRWMVTGVVARDADDGGGEDGPRSAGEAWLEVTPDGEVAGHGGVNRFGSRARTDGERLYLGPVRSTRMAGPPEAMAAETAFLEALGAVATYAVESDRLELRDQDGAPLVRLRRG